MNLEKQALIVLGNLRKITIGREKQKEIRLLRNVMACLGIRLVKQVTGVIEVKITSENSERKG